MKSIGILILALLIVVTMPSNGFSQAKKNNKIHKVEAVYTAPLIPPSALTDTDTLSSWFKNQYGNPEIRLKAIYAWILKNIKYDHASAFEFTLTRGNHTERANSALAIRKEVCAGIAALFQTLCSKSGMEAYTISGYTRREGFVGHAWAAVRLNDGYFLFDPTWDISSHDDPNYRNQPWVYFKVPSSEFIISHMPFDPLWQLSVSPISFQNFDNRQLKAKASQKIFSFVDSIEIYKNQNDEARIAATYRRMSALKPTNYVITAYGSDLRRSIEINKQNLQTVKYNRLKSAMDSANLTSTIFVTEFNNYIQHYNTHFTTVKNDEMLKNNMKQMKNNYEIAGKYNQLSLLLADDEINKNIILSNQKQLDDLGKRFVSHDLFVAKYLSKSKAGRGFIWLSKDLPQ